MKPAFIIPIATGRKEVRDKDTINNEHPVLSRREWMTKGTEENN